MTFKTYCNNIHACQLVNNYLNMEDKGCKKSYILYEKWESVERANEVGIQESYQQLSIPRKNFRWWTKQGEELKNVALTWGGTIGSRRRMRCSKAQYLLLKIALIVTLNFQLSERSVFDSSVLGRQNFVDQVFYTFQ